MKRISPKLVFIFPCYNEEDVLPFSWQTIKQVLLDLKNSDVISADSFALFVDDGSTDKTWAIIESMIAENCASVHGIKLAGNVGHQNALYAGMARALDYGADCIISLDVDLQDDISVTKVMLEHFAAGDDIVYGVRTERAADTFFKRSTASAFYLIMRMLKIKLIPHHSDYRLCSRPVLNALMQIREADLFLRAVFPSLGFKFSTVSYVRRKREHGESKYPVRKMLSFAWRGITSFSAAPLRFAGYMASAFFLFAVILFCWILKTIFSDSPVPGWASLMTVSLFFGAAQLFCLSIIGEYLAKLFLEVKQRPRYIIEKDI